MTTKALLVMKEITKKFPGVIANDAVDFAVERGEIHALVGENGAGKSTLMHVLTGIHQADQGSILLEGEEVKLNSPADAFRHGVGMVYQHFMLIPELTVLDNLILGTEPRRGPVLDRRSGAQKAKELMNRYNLDLPLHQRVRDLPVSMQQQVEIMRCLLREVNLLILDEPTSVLTPQEADSLGQGLKALVAEGNTVIFISHKLGEVLKIADRITILRDGKVVGVVKAAETTERELARLMVGREIKLPEREPSLQKDKGSKVLLQVKELNLQEQSAKPLLDQINFTIAPGEILGLAAVSGNGQSELVEVLVGLRALSEGSIFLKEEDITSTTVEERWRRGLAYIPQDRRGRGTAPWINLAWNMAIRGYFEPPLAKGFILNEGNIRRRTQDIIDRFEVRTTGVNADIQTLSGGNLQKAVVGRELTSNPVLLMAEDPTQGLDIGSIEQVRGMILDFAEKGGGVLLVSQDLSEVLSLSDRVMVMYEGRIVGEYLSKELDLEQIGLLMAGLGPDHENKEVDLDADGNATT